MESVQSFGKDLRQRMDSMDAKINKACGGSGKMTKKCIGF